MPGSKASAVQYFDGLRPIRSSAESYDRDKALDLWETSERLLTHADEVTQRISVMSGQWRRTGGPASRSRRCS